MPVVSTTRDTDALTLTLVADLAAPAEKVWELWEDAHQLSQWWGPPSWPATFVTHELAEGGESRYYMTGPDGERALGWWTTTTVTSPSLIEFDDGFAGPDGEPLDRSDCTHNVVTLATIDDGTRMTITAHFRDGLQMEQMSAMDMEQGLTEAVSQMDDLLA